MYGGESRSWVAYVGVTGTDLRGRIEQHLVRRDSSVATGASAVGLNPDHVREIAWWEDDRFSNRSMLEAAAGTAATERRVDGRPAPAHSSTASTRQQRPDRTTARACDLRTARTQTWWPS